MLQNTSQFAKFVWSLLLSDSGGWKTYSEEEIAQMLEKDWGNDFVVAHLRQIGCSLSEILGSSSYFMKDADGWRAMDGDGRSLEDDYQKNINRDGDRRFNQLSLTSSSQQGHRGEGYVYSDIHHNHLQQNQVSLPGIAITNSGQESMMLSDTAVMSRSNTQSRTLAQQDHHGEGYVYPNVHQNRLHQEKVRSPNVSTNSEAMVLTSRYKNGGHQESIAWPFVQPTDGGNVRSENHHDPFQSPYLAQDQLGAELYSNFNINQDNQHRVRSLNVQSDKGRTLPGSIYDTGLNGGGKSHQEFSTWPFRNENQQNMFQNNGLVQHDFHQGEYLHPNSHRNQTNQRQASPMSSTNSNGGGMMLSSIYSNGLNALGTDRQESSIRPVYSHKNLFPYNVTEGRQLVAEFYSKLNHNLHNQHQASPPYMQSSRRDTTYNSGLSRVPNNWPFGQSSNGDNIRNENQRNLYQDYAFSQQQDHRNDSNPNILLNQHNQVIPPIMSSKNLNGGGMMSGSSYNNGFTALGGDMYPNDHYSHSHQEQVSSPNVSSTNTNSGGMMSTSRCSNGGQHDQHESIAWPFVHPTDDGRTRNEYHQDVVQNHVMAMQNDQQLRSELYFNNQLNQHQVSPPNMHSNREGTQAGSTYNTGGGDNQHEFNTWPFVQPSNSDHIRNENQQSMLQNNALVRGQPAELYSNFNQNQHYQHHDSPSNMPTAHLNGREIMMSNRYCNLLNGGHDHQDSSTRQFTQTENGDDTGSYSQQILFSNNAKAKENHQADLDLYNNILRNFQQQGIDPVDGSYDIGQLLNRGYECHVERTNSPRIENFCASGEPSQQFPRQTNGSPVLPHQTEPERHQESWTDPTDLNYSNHAENHENNLDNDFFEKWEESSFNDNLVSFDYELEQQSPTPSSISTLTNPSTSRQRAQARAASLPCSTGTLEELADRFGVKLPENSPDIVKPSVEIEENVKNFMAKFESMSITDQLHAHDELQDPDPVVVHARNVVNQVPRSHDLDKP
ncbi:hypothetical protein GCK72_025861 [Caenorhabditis remanei]|uniref:Uncharacterized protein n=1 Tax=Caenorhabditis remanei TaxID=31234 RepID=A0A6A5G3L0_CAERE|nr:hypothetical protein GCK72_025861 [Caenorhabditis remanei]KAF1749393.1 hypothetical protein GCK72_025861 [Caenorhabditis remanei]